MSSYPSDDSVPASTPMFEETVTATAVRFDDEPAEPGSTGTDRPSAVRGAAGQAKDTVADTAGVAQEQVQKVGATAADAGERVGETAKDQAAKVATDAVSQARELYGQASEQLSEQAGKQQKDAAATLHTFSDDLSSMRSQDQNDGLAAELVQSLSVRAGRVADWLEAREPGEVLDEVKQFAARRPGLFIGLAAITGVIAARSVKALTAPAKSGASSAAASDAAPSTNQVRRTAEIHPVATGDTAVQHLGDVR